MTWVATQTRIDLKKTSPISGYAIWDAGVKILVDASLSRRRDLLLGLSEANCFCGVIFVVREFVIQVIILRAS